MWVEGTLLTAPHLQLWDQHLHQRAALPYQAPHQQGIRSFSYDKLALHSGQLQVVQVEWIMQGAHYTYHQEASFLPLSLTLPTSTSDILLIFLGRIRANTVHGIEGYPSHPLPEARWKADYKAYPDCYDKTREAELGVLIPHWQLWAEKLPNTAEGVLLGRLLYYQGHWIWDDSFWAPCLSITCWARLYQQCEALVSLLHSDTTLRSLSYRLRQALQLSEHPKTVYLILLEISAVLNLPLYGTYQHEHLSTCFSPLLQALSGKLSVQIITTLSFKRLEPSFWQVTSIPTEWFSSPVLFLGVKGLISSEQAKQLSRWIKIASPQDIEAVILASVSGVSVLYRDIVPLNICAAPQTIYFELKTDVPLWRNIQQERAMSVWVSPNSVADYTFTLTPGQL